MTNEEFVDEFEKVRAFYQRPDAEKQPEEFKDYNTWLVVIYDKVKWIDTIKFRMVVDVLLDVRPRFRRDLDHRRIVAIYNDLAEKNGWKLNVERHCGGCNGLRFVYVWLSDKKGQTFRAAKGCGNCNAKMSSISPNYIEIPAPDQPFVDPRANIKKIPPFMAQCLLNIADSARLELKEDLQNDLMEAAAKPGLKTYHPGKYDEERRKNEMVRALLMAPPVQVVEAGTAEEAPAITEPPPVHVAPPMPRPEQPSPAAPTEEPAEEPTGAIVPF
jgi:hypothetical protein